MVNVFNRCPCTLVEVATPFASPQINRLRIGKYGREISPVMQFSPGCQKNNKGYYSSSAEGPYVDYQFSPLRLAEDLVDILRTFDGF